MKVKILHGPTEALIADLQAAKEFIKNLKEAER